MPVGPPIQRLLLTVLLAPLLSACGDSEIDKDWLAPATLEEIQLVDPAGTTNMGFPMLFDEQGEPHLAYLRSGKQAVVYAHRSGATWNTETVVQNDDFWNGLALGLNGSNEPVVTYQRMVSGYTANLEISERSNGAWSADTIDTDGWVGSQTSIQVFPSGHIRIAYFSGYPHYDLRYAERIAGEWMTATVDSAGLAGYSPGLASDQNGEPVIVYSAGNRIGIATRNMGPWIFQTLDEGTYISFGHASTIDSSSLLHVAYHRDGAFRYAVQNAPGSWGSEVIERSGQTTTSLVVDAQNEPWYASDWLPAKQTHTLGIGTRHEGRWFFKEFPEAGEIENVTMARSHDGRLAVAYVTSGDSLFFAWIRP